MPPRYLITTPIEEITYHFNLLAKRSQKKIITDHRVLEKEGVNQVTLWTVNNPKLFSQMAGIFSSNHINIIGADIFVSKEGEALLLFRVTDHQGHMIRDFEKWERVEKDIQEILTGRLPVEMLVAEKFKPSVLKAKFSRKIEPRVEMDNDVSGYYTVIDVFANDRIGLLYQIVSTLMALGFYVEVSKISTKVDKVNDSFYVKDIFGHKITQKERLDRAKEALMKILMNEPTPDWRPLS